MSYFAEIDKDNLVKRVLIVAEQRDKKWLSDTFGGSWVKVDGDNPGIGWTWDAKKSAFIPPQPFDSWVLNEEALKWEAPSPRPEGDFYWDEETTSWVELEIE